MGCAAYVFSHKDQRQNEMSPQAELMMFIGFTDGMKGWKFMRSTNAIFHATQAVFDESTFLHCPGSWASIPAIETGVLNIDKTNIPLEEFEVPQAPPAVMIRFMIVNQSPTILMVVHQIFDITTRDMEGSSPGIGIIQP